MIPISFLITKKKRSELILSLIKSKKNIFLYNNKTAIRKAFNY